MALTPGSRIGPYQIVSAIGAGGMGEVYVARDARLDRDVAIKILPAAFASDGDRVSRFQREAKILASLNHPNIGGIHGIEETDGVIALVMELVDGEDLAQRIARGAMPLDEALPVARQIAEALDAAHERGIIHRDLKPANIKVRVDGTVKVLDFGLAKPMETPGGAGNSSQSPTITTPAFTQAGMILGTAAYMSPEQARAKPVDKRTDIWSFGCVLYEMLTGRHPFPGDGVSDVMASVLAREPDLSVLPSRTPAPIRQLLRRCLQKERNDRLRDIGDARMDITEALAHPNNDTMSEPGPSAPTRPLKRIVSVALLAALLLSIAVVAWSVARPRPAPSELRLDIATPPTAVATSVAISPDGRTIAYVADSAGHSRLWLRTLETGATRVIAGTEAAEAPFWSPDSQSLGFFAEGKLRRVEVAGGSVQTISNAWSGLGGTWNQNGVILFASLGNPIVRVPASGGAPVALEHLMLRGSNFAPHFLPDGQHFLYYVRGNPEVRGVYVGELDATATRSRLLEADTGAVYSTSGHLLFVREGQLLAQPFDPAKLVVSGSPVPIAGEIGSTRPDTGVSVSRDGVIAFRQSPMRTQWQFAWFDRSGKELAKVGTPSTIPIIQPSLSPDGQRVAFYRGMDGNVDIWLLDIKRAALRRFTSDPADDVLPVWSPDGGSIVFSSNRTGVHNLYRKLTTGGTEEVLLATPDHKIASDWSTGGFLLFTIRDPKRSVDIWSLPVDGKTKAFPVAHTDFDEDSGQFSPDGHWIAYVSNESGRAEIYLQAFPGAGDKWLVSTSGGRQLRWGRDGKELFYVSPDGRLMSVQIRLGSSSAAPDVGTPVSMFAPPIGHAVQRADFRHQYMLSADSQQILVVTVLEEATAPITVILNWKQVP